MVGQYPKGRSMEIMSKLDNFGAHLGTNRRKHRPRGSQEHGITLMAGNHVLIVRLTT